MISGNTIFQYLNNSTNPNSSAVARPAPEPPKLPAIAEELGAVEDPYFAFVV